MRWKPAIGKRQPISVAALAAAADSTMSPGRMPGAHGFSVCFLLCRFVLLVLAQHAEADGGAEHYVGRDQDDLPGLHAGMAMLLVVGPGVDRSVENVVGGFPHVSDVGGGGLVRDLVGAARPSSVNRFKSGCSFTLSPRDEQYVSNARFETASGGFV